MLLGYLLVVFRVWSPDFRQAGLGDWIDPYFINALLEHWYQSAKHLTNPASPPMFYPARGTLGYSHGLILFAPFYIAFRPFVHPFAAHTLAVLAVMAVGVVCLFGFLRMLRTSRSEALLLTFFFVSSRNIINPAMSSWSQRASVFLIPPILLIAVVSWRMPPRRLRLMLAVASGLLAALMYVQDFYTAQFAVFFAGVAAAPSIWVSRRLRDWSARVWARQDARSRAALAVGVTALAWTWYVRQSGGGHATIAGMRLTFHDWVRPAAVAGAALLIYLLRSRRVLFATGLPASLPERRGRIGSWATAFASGAALGLAIFFAIYLGPYLEHRKFPEADLLNAIVPASLHPYESMRCFALALFVWALAWAPANKTSRIVAPRYSWFIAISAVVILLAMSIGTFSLWRATFELIPGFSVIRDPRRVIYLYELSLVIAVGLFSASLPKGSWQRWAIGAAIGILLALDWNTHVLTYSRPITTYERWMAAPIAMSPSCRSFYIKAASPNYASRSESMFALYNVDALFIALENSIPTLNGYSAWAPAGWDLVNPQDAAYRTRVRRWSESHGLSGVCALDLESRTLSPRPE